MKRYMIALLVLLLSSSINFDVVAIEYDVNKPITLEACCYCIKEVTVFFLYHNFFINHSMIQQICFECSECHYSVDYYYLFGWFAGEYHPKGVEELKRLGYYNSLSAFGESVLHVMQGYTVPCPRCNKYQGWYQVEKNNQEEKA